MNRLQLELHRLYLTQESAGQDAPAVEPYPIDSDAAAVSLDDVVITAFTTGPGSTTLPLLIWSKVKLGVTPDINALATLMVLAVGLGVIVAGIIMNRAEARRLADERLAYRTNG